MMTVGLEGGPSRGLQKKNSLIVTISDDMRSRIKITDSRPEHHAQIPLRRTAGSHAGISPSHHCAVVCPNRMAKNEAWPGKHVTRRHEGEYEVSQDILTHV